MSRFLICVGMTAPSVLLGLGFAYVASTIVGILPAIMLVMCCKVELLVAIFALAPAIGSVTLVVFATILLCLGTIVGVIACLVEESLQYKNKETLEV